MSLRRVAPSAVQAAHLSPVDPPTLAAARAILEEVRAGGEDALRAHALRLHDLEPGAPLVHDRAALRAAAEALPEDQHALLVRAAARIRAFADAQRGAFVDVDVAVPGGPAAVIRFPPRCS